ncbi:MAG: cytochrome c biogenesis protein CcsA [Verrucomicrobiota bacterium]|jgi:ABC-type transport system involved in cytochrome c biogenesis permease subunit
MAWFTDRHFFLLAVAFYGLSTVYSVFLWRIGFRRDDHANYFLLLAAFALHTAAMVKRGFSAAHCPVNNLYEATIFVAWTIVAAYLVIGLLSRLRFLGAFASPVLFAIGVFALMPELDPSRGPQPEFSGALVSLHAATILLAYGAFGLGAVAAAMFLMQQHDLKFHKLRAVLSLFPPIQRLEIIAVRLVCAGFVLLTVGLAAGRYLPRPADKPYWTDPKVVWSIFLWFVYLALLGLRRLRVPSSRGLAVCLIAAFVFLLLTFWGTNLLSPLHHP